MTDNIYQIKWSDHKQHYCNLWYTQAQTMVWLVSIGNIQVDKFPGFKKISFLPGQIFTETKSKKVYLQNELWLQVNTTAQKLPVVSSWSISSGAFDKFHENLSLVDNKIMCSSYRNKVSLKSYKEVWSMIGKWNNFYVTNLLKKATNNK